MRSSRAVAANLRGLSMPGGSSYCGICVRCHARRPRRCGIISMPGGSSHCGICAQCHAKQPRRCRKPAGLKHARRLKLLRHMRAVSCKAALLLWHNLRGLSMSGGSSHCGICAQCHARRPRAMETSKRLSARQALCGLERIGGIQHPVYIYAVALGRIVYEDVRDRAYQHAVLH